MPESNFSPTMRDYIRVLFRQKAVFITCVVAVMLTVIAGLLLKTPTYTASVKLIITAAKQIEASYYRDIYYNNPNIEISLTQSEIVKSMPVINRAVGAISLWQRPLDYETKFASKIKQPFIKIRTERITKRFLSKATEAQKKATLFRLAVEDLKQHIKVDPVRDTNMFTIRVTDYSPIGAAVLANVVSRSYLIFDLEQQLAELQIKYGEKHLSVLQLQDNIAKMTKSLNGEPLSDVDAIGPASVKIIEQAQVPFKQDGLPRPFIVSLALLMSIFLGSILSFAFEYMDQTFKSPNDIESFLNLPYLGSIPPRPNAKSFDLIDEQLLLLSKDKGLKTLMFTAPTFELESQGVVEKIARSISDKETLKILVIDTNFRKTPSKQVKGKPANIETGTGLVNLISGKATFDQSIRMISKNFYLLAPGKTELNPVTLLDSTRMKSIFQDASNMFDLILVETPDLTTKESLLITNYVDGVILVVNENKTRKQVAKAMLDPLKNKNAKILGVILNNRRFTIPKIIYERV